jgi:DNA-binding Xre family transcriptional regulator
MKRSSTIFLQVVIVLIGIGALALMLWFPHIEGRNVDATVSQIYFNDPFLAYAYIASIAFFTALYQAFKLLGYIRQNKVFTLNSVRALRTIKYCAISLIGFIIVAEAYIFIVVSKKDDIAGGVVLGLFMFFVSVVTATAAATLERILQNAVDLKSEKNNMAIIINNDVMLAKRKMSVTELSEKVGITMANLSILKNGKARAVRFSTLEAICKALECQPGDILEYKK